MKVEAWSRAAHWDLLESWAVARGLPGLGFEDCYPHSGFVVDDCAAGFLYRTDAPGLAWVGSIIASPHVPKERRRAALRELIRALKGVALKTGVRHLVSFPGPLPLAKMMAEEGWMSDSKPHYFMQIELEGA
jgi:hypothetical protein